MTQDLDPKQKAAVLMEALPYIQEFKGSTFVIKFGGAFMETAEDRNRVAKDAAFLALVGINVVIVHGGGKAISRNMEKAGIDAVFKNGMRYTDQEAIEIVAKTLDDEINLDLCEILQGNKCRPLPVPGRTVFRCDKLKKDEDGNEVDLGFVGDIKWVNARLIQSSIKKGYTPIVSPTAEDSTGQVYNVNADVAAAHAAAALGARRLVYMCDTPGLLSNPDNQESLISTLYADQVNNLKEEGVIGGGMRPKVDSAVLALQGGVHRVHFVDARMPHSMLLEIFTDKGVGTEIVNR